MTSYVLHRDFGVSDVIVTANAWQKSRLQSMAVACGRVHVPKRNSQVTLSVAGTADDNSTECQQASRLVHSGMFMCQLLVVDDVHRTVSLFAFFRCWTDAKLPHD